MFSESTRRAAVLRTILRLMFIGVMVVLVNLGLNWMLFQLDAPGTAGQKIMLTTVVFLSLLLYALLMAIPFVPGIEIGVSLLMMQGATVAPMVFAATFLGLTIAFLTGRYLSYDWLHRIFADLGLRRACQLLERLKPLDQETRIAQLQDRLPNWLGKHLVGSRYLIIALALNIPGNALVGGGGGIALVAGLSRIYSVPLTLVTFALAVAPVPLAVIVFGSGILK